MSRSSSLSTASSLDPYQVLGIRRNTSQEQIKVAYDALCQSLAADKSESKTRSTPEFTKQQVAWAYGVLSRGDEKGVILSRHFPMVGNNPAVVPVGVRQASAPVVSKFTKLFGLLNIAKMDLMSYVMAHPDIAYDIWQIQSKSQLPPWLEPLSFKQWWHFSFENEQIALAVLNILPKENINIFDYMYDQVKKFKSVYEKILVTKSLRESFDFPGEALFQLMNIYPDLKGKMLENNLWSIRIEKFMNFRENLFKKNVEGLVSCYAEVKELFNKEYDFMSAIFKMALRDKEFAKKIIMNSTLSAALHEFSFLGKILTKHSLDVAIKHDEIFNNSVIYTRDKKEKIRIIKGIFQNFPLHCGFSVRGELIEIFRTIHSWFNEEEKKQMIDIVLRNSNKINENSSLSVSQAYEILSELFVFNEGKIDQSFMDKLTVLKDGFDRLERRYLLLENVKLCRAVWKEYRGFLSFFDWVGLASGLMRTRHQVSGGHYRGAAHYAGLSIIKEIVNNNRLLKDVSPGHYVDILLRIPDENFLDALSNPIFVENLTGENLHDLSSSIGESNPEFWQVVNSNHILKERLLVYLWLKNDVDVDKDCDGVLDGHLGLYFKKRKNFDLAEKYFLSSLAKGCFEGFCEYIDCVIEGGSEDNECRFDDFFESCFLSFKSELLDDFNEDKFRISFEKLRVAFPGNIKIYYLYLFFIKKHSVRFSRRPCAKLLSMSYKDIDSLWKCRYQLEENNFMGDISLGEYKIKGERFLGDGTILHVPIKRSVNPSSWLHFFCFLAVSYSEDLFSSSSVITWKNIMDVFDHFDHNDPIYISLADVLESLFYQKSDIFLEFLNTSNRVSPNLLSEKFLFDMFDRNESHRHKMLKKFTVLAERYVSGKFSGVKISFDCRNIDFYSDCLVNAWRGIVFDPQQNTSTKIFAFNDILDYLRPSDLKKNMPILKREIPPAFLAEIIYDSHWLRELYSSFVFSRSWVGYWFEVASDEIKLSETRKLTCSIGEEKVADKDNREIMIKLSNTLSAMYFLLPATAVVSGEDRNKLQRAFNDYMSDLRQILDKGATLSDESIQALANNGHFLGILRFEPGQLVLNKSPMFPLLKIIMRECIVDQSIPEGLSILDESLDALEGGLMNDIQANDVDVMLTFAELAVNENNGGEALLACLCLMARLPPSFFNKKARGRLLHVSEKVSLINECEILLPYRLFDSPLNVAALNQKTEVIDSILSLPAGTDWLAQRSYFYEKVSQINSSAASGRVSEKKEGHFERVYLSRFKKLSGSGRLRPHTLFYYLNAYLSLVLSKRPHQYNSIDMVFSFAKKSRVKNRDFVPFSQSVVAIMSMFHYFKSKESVVTKSDKKNVIARKAHFYGLKEWMDNEKKSIYENRDKRAKVCVDYLLKAKKSFTSFGRSRQYYSRIAAMVTCLKQDPKRFTIAFDQLFQLFLEIKLPELGSTGSKSEKKDSLGSAMPSIKP